MKAFFIIITALQFISLNIFSQPPVSKKGTDLTSIIKVSNKEIKRELRNFKLVPGKTMLAHYYEGYDSVSFYRQQRVAVASFYINAFEVSNGDYREFVDYVLDSMIGHLMGYEKYFGRNENPIDWEKVKAMDLSKGIEQYSERLYAILLPPDKRVLGKKQFDVEKLLYTFTYHDSVIQTPIYPDTLCWMRDYYYTYCEPMAKKYYSHPAYNNYPVAGINYWQALAYCDWKTKQLKKYLPAGYELSYTLPTEYEWESAATAYNSIPIDKEKNASPLFTPQLDKPVSYDSHGKSILNCNFFQIKDENGYVVMQQVNDGYFYTAPINAFEPSDIGVYNMHGNVAEWTLNSGDEDAGETIKSFGTTKEGKKNMAEYLENFKNTLFYKMPLDSFCNYMKQFKVVKGGGWNSTPFYLQNGVNQYYLPGDDKSFIGFRPVIHLIAKQK